MNWDEITPKLNAKLDPRNVKKPSGSFGPKGDYIEGWHAIAEANEIFGFGGWSYEIDLRQDALTEGKDSRDNPQWQAAYTCVCTLKVGDATRQDVGFGSGFSKGIGDAIEGATKEAATDALKRALRTFGNRFGLALYDKTRENVGVDTPPFDSAGAASRIKASIEKADARGLEALWSGEKETMQILEQADFDNVRAAFTARKAELQQTEQQNQAA
jgi:DNA recombination protein Rad52